MFDFAVVMFAVASLRGCPCVTPGCSERPSVLSRQINNSPFSRRVFHSRDLRKDLKEEENCFSYFCFSSSTDINFGF